MAREMITIPKGGRPRKELPQDLLQLQKTGMTWTQLAVHYGVSAQTIGRWLKRAREESHAERT